MERGLAHFLRLMGGWWVGGVVDSVGGFWDWGDPFGGAAWLPFVAWIGMTYGLLFRRSPVGGVWGLFVL